MLYQLLLILFDILDGRSELPICRSWYSIKSNLFYKSNQGRFELVRPVGSANSIYWLEGHSQMKLGKELLNSITGASSIHSCQEF